MNEHLSDEQLSLLIDGQLSLVARAAVSAHLGSCPACAERHDALVEVAASLRLRTPLTWSEGAGERTIALLGKKRPGRERALPIALALGAAASALAVLELPFVVGPGIAHALLHVLTSFAPTGLLPSDRSLAILLAAVAALGLFVYPLARGR